jgi:hypothetical protein
VVEILVDVGRVDDDERAVVGDLRHQQIIHRGAVFAAHHGVENAVVGKFGAVVGHDLVEVLEGVGTRHDELAHVTHVEQPHALAHGGVLLDETCVAHRHVEAGERNHLRTCREVRFI